MKNIKFQLFFLIFFFIWCQKVLSQTEKPSFKSKAESENKSTPVIEKYKFQHQAGMRAVTSVNENNTSTKILPIDKQKAVYIIKPKNTDTTEK